MRQSSSSTHQKSVILSEVEGPAVCRSAQIFTRSMSKRTDAEA